MTKALIILLRSPLWKLAIRFDLIDFFLDIYWRKYTKYWEIIKKTGYIEKPKSIWFEPTMRCNLNCSFCHQRERRKQSTQEIDIKTIEKFLDEASGWGIKWIEMTGGEIFLRKDIFQILDLIEERKMKVKLATNGMLNDNIIDRLKSYRCIASVAVSLDGPPQLHNRLRNSPIAYKKAVETLRRLSGSSFFVVIYSLLLPDDREKIEFLVDLAKKLRVDRLTFMPEMFYPSGYIEDTMNYLSFDDTEEKIFVEVKDINNIEEYTQKMIDSFKALKEIRQRKGVFAPVIPRLSYKYPYDFFSYSLHKSKKLICKHFYSLTIIENGDVLICPFIHRKIGNVKEESIKKLWNSHKMRLLRQQILRSNLLPICRKCCALDYVE